MLVARTAARPAALDVEQYVLADVWHGGVVMRELLLQLASCACVMCGCVVQMFGMQCVGAVMTRFLQPAPG